ncbi:MULTISPECIES: ABC transporter ATP-binding protein [Aeromonas]|uniref:ABC transporter ATP-binding protein n=1 Tax=Aeromonas media TaxID=651 RepID=A0A6M4YC22_AERME|nr:ABC transporter ATP-binding protein [Aeromonas media]MBS4641290.1 ABC transporter ATP-binding protein [Aeromonas media]QJT22540.1 ABC transporter ATP-binding protein [Aeromonas media]QYK82938.1 ABC transporter ATP-binding protein [Aeromonas media]
MSTFTDSTLLLVSNIGKTYRVFDTPMQRLKDLLGLDARFHEQVALIDASFRVEHGETVAIVGANGSGKSTLLQMICGTLTPSKGTVECRGRIAALLELGAGFNPEFTGMENVFLNASINGLSHNATEAVLPQILAFADIGEYINQPVKTYSSGMFVRLAFSVAIHVEPDLLIIDEALAVGDEAFQRKCFARLRDLQSRGVSILFVSHSAESVISLCDRAILLDHGSLLRDGDPKQIVGLYQKLLYARPEQRDEIRTSIMADVDSCDLNNETDSSIEPISSDEMFSHESEHDDPFNCPDLIPVDPDYYVEGLEARSIDYFENGASIDMPMLLDESGTRVNILHKGCTYIYRYRVRFNEDAFDVSFGTLLKRIDGVSLGGASTSPPKVLSNLHIIENSVRWVDFKFKVRLNEGAYFLNAGVLGSTKNHDGFLARKLDALMFKVLPQDNECSTSEVDFGFSTNIHIVD